MGSAPDDRHVRPLAALDGEDEPRFGGKSATLGTMIGAGIPVPPGFAVSTAAFEEFMAGGLAAEAARTLDGLDPEDVAALGAAADSLAAAILTTPVPAPVTAALERGYAELAAATGEPQPPVAVRSSARGEDSEEATFAGQQDTFLWVRGLDAVGEAVRACWASLFSAPAISYRARMGAPGEEAAMGVTVQLMVDAEVSGVLFTCSPLNGDPSVIAVNSSWGLGLGVVGGEVTPDEFLISKVTGEVMRRTVNRKHLSYVAAPGGGAPVEAPVDPALQEAPSLDDAQLAELAVLGRRIERHFGRPQDIEWSIPRGAEGGEIFVLQARPVTTVAAEAERPRATGSALSLVMRSFGAGDGEAR